MNDNENETDRMAIGMMILFGAGLAWAAFAHFWFSGG